MLPEVHLKTWTKLCKTYQFNIPITTTAGGSSRFQSVKRGLQLIVEDGLVAIHDGVRPLVDLKLIERSYEIADNKGSAVASIPMKDSIRIINSEQSLAVNRAEYRIIQTPQTFSIGRIKNAYKLDENDTFTDDASVWEAAGNPVSLIEGSEKNIKITTVQDLMIAEITYETKMRDWLKISFSNKTA